MSTLPLQPQLSRLFHLHAQRPRRSLAQTQPTSTGLHLDPCLARQRLHADALARARALRAQAPRRAGQRVWAWWVQAWWVQAWRGRA